MKYIETCEVYRKRAALHPPISSICSALGGFEEFLDENGNVYTAYSLGDQVVGKSPLSPRRIAECKLNLEMRNLS